MTPPVPAAGARGGLDGLLLVDKPAGPTSHDVVMAVRRACGTRRVGHAGTLDPFATGLLACLVGRATRLQRCFAASEKAYAGVAAFGVATDTGDCTGRPIGDPVSVELDAAAIREAARRLTGDVLQVPPMYSAKKRDGVALHVLARRGVEIERAALPVRVGEWTIDEPVGSRVAFRVTVSAGTYVRVLVEDLGALLGAPAHLESLRRLASGGLRVEDALSLDELSRQSVLERLLPLDAIALPLPEARLEGGAARADFLHGRAVRAGDWRSQDREASRRSQDREASRRSQDREASRRSQDREASRRSQDREASRQAVGEGSEVGVRDAEGALLGLARVEDDGRLSPDVVLAGE